MKTALALVACLAALGLVASADSYTVGVEIVPHTISGMGGSFARPYLMVGYDAGFLVTGIGTNTPLSIGTGSNGGSDGWYMAYLGPAFQVSPIFRGYGGLAFWLRMQNYTVSDGRWSVWAGVNWTVSQTSFKGWGVEFSVFGKAHLPYQILAGRQYLGVWFTVGATVGLAPPQVK